MKQAHHGLAARHGHGTHAVSAGRVARMRNTVILAGAAALLAFLGVYFYAGTEWTSIAIAASLLAGGAMFVATDPSQDRKA